MRKVNKKTRKTKIYNVGLSQRIINALTSVKIEYIEDVANMTKGEVLRIPHIGIKSINEIKVLLNTKGISCKF